MKNKIRYVIRLPLSPGETPRYYVNSAEDTEVYTSKKAATRELSSSRKEALKLYGKLPPEIAEEYRGTKIVALAPGELPPEANLGGG